MPPAPVLLVIAGPAGSGKSTLCDRLVAESPEFKQLLVKYNLPYAYEDGATVASKFPAEIEWYTQYFKEVGLLK